MKEKRQTKKVPSNRSKGKIELNRKVVVTVALLIVVLIGYCLYKVVALIQNPTNTFSVEQGKIYQEEAATGYIIREETVVKGNNYKNGMVQIKTEGERVAKNEAIFRYYSSRRRKLDKKNCRFRHQNR